MTAGRAPNRQKPHRSPWPGHGLGTALARLWQPPRVISWLLRGKAGQGSEEDLNEWPWADDQTPSDPAEEALFWSLSDPPRRDDRPRDQERDLPGTPLAGGRAKPLAAFTADDWAKAVRVLVRSGDPADLWQWALLAPPPQSRTLLQALPAGATPPPHLGEGARGLLGLARDLPEDWDGAELLPDQCARILTVANSGTDPLSFAMVMLAWSPDGGRLASRHRDGSIRLWDPASGSCGLTLRAQTGDAGSMAWSPDGRLLATGGGSDARVLIWDAVNGTCLHTLAGHTGWVRRLAWSPDGRLLATGCPPADHGRGAPGCEDGTIRLWEATSGACIQTLSGHEGGVRALAWSPDGRSLASSGSDSTTRMWDPDLGVCTNVFVKEGYRDRGFGQLAWSPGGGLLASCDIEDTKVHVWDPATDTCLHELSCGWGVFSVRWSPDGRLTAVAGDGTLWVWDPEMGTTDHFGQLERIDRMCKDDEQWVVWSPDLLGAYVATQQLSSHRQTIRVFHGRTGVGAEDLDGHVQWKRSTEWSRVSALAWSPDGQCLASAGDDSTIRLWRSPLRDLMLTPLACFTPHHWSLLEASKTTPQSMRQARPIDPWLAFLSALGSVIRRFDVDVDEAIGPTHPSSFEVLIAAELEP